MRNYLILNRIWRSGSIAIGVTIIALLTLLWGLCGAVSAQTLVLRYPFDDAGPGTTTPSETTLGSELNVTLQMLNKSAVSTNLHGPAGSGVAGLTNPNRALNVSSNTSHGASGNFAAVTNSALGLGNVSSFVVTMWMKQSIGLPNTTGGRMFILGNSTNTDAGTANSISMKWQDASHLYFYVNTVQATAAFSSNLPTNAWIFVAMSYDGANVTLYEGTDQNAATLVSTTPTVQSVSLGSAASLFLGNRLARDRDFVGWIDDFRVYTGSGDANFIESVRQAAAGPSGLTGVPGDSVVTLNWNALAGATSYNVKRATTSGGPYTTISTPGTVTGTSYPDSTAVNGTTYYYTVSAQTAAGETANSTTEVSATPSVPPPVPMNLTPTPGDGQILLNWDPSAGAATYNVKRSTTTGQEVTITNVSAATVTDASVVNGITYYYEVSALNATGSESANSDEVPATPVGPPPAPSTLTAFGAAIGEVGLNWSTSLLATSYNVYRSTTSGGTYTMISTPGTVTTTGYVDATATGSANYYYKVSAVNGNGEGPLSAFATAAPLNPRLRFDFSDTGTTTTDSIAGVVLNMVDGNNVAADYHGPADSGVSGAGKTLDFSSNPFNSPTTGPLASTTLNPTLAFGTISNFTLAFWVKPDSDFFTSGNIVATNNPRLLVLSPINVVDYPATIPSTVPGVFIKINSYDASAHTGELKVFFNNAEYVTPEQSFVSAPGLWSFVALTYDGTRLKVYSATETNAANLASSVIYSVVTTNQLLNFSTNGNMLLFNSGALTKSADGWMSDFRFYTGAGDSNFVENVRLLAQSPPDGVMATGGDSQVGLSWNAFGEATSYNIKRATSSGGPYTVISTPGSVTGTTFNDSTAVNGSTYYYVVSAATVYGESGDSAEVGGTASCTPPPTAGNDGPVCAGSTLNLTASTVDGATYSWTGPNGFNSADQNPSITGVTAAAAGVYSVTVTVGACTSVPGMTTAVVHETTSPTPGYNSPIYEGMTLNLSASTVVGATYSWTGPNGFSSSDQNPSIANVTAAGSGDYSVTATVDGCPSAPALVSVTVNPPASVSVQFSGGSLILDWPFGTLQSATNIIGPWDDVIGATPPYTNDIIGPQEYYRVKLQ